jgi:hypothetical protein
MYDVVNTAEFKGLIMEDVAFVWVEPRVVSRVINKGIGLQ